MKAHPVGPDTDRYVKAVASALAAHPTEVRRLGVDAEQVAWVGALELPVDPATGAGRALRRAGRGGRSEVSLDARTAAGGPSRGERLAESPPVPGVDLGNLLDLMPMLRRDVFAAKIIGDGDPDDRLARLMVDRKMAKAYVATDLADTKHGRMIGELTVALYRLGVFKLPPDMASMIGAMVMLTQRHPTEFAKLAQLEADLINGAVGAGSPRGISDVALATFGLTFDQVTGDNRHRDDLSVAARAVAIAACWRYSDAGATVLAGLYGCDRTSVRWALASFSDRLREPVISERWHATAATLEAAGLHDNGHHWPIMAGKGGTPDVCSVPDCGARLRVDNTRGVCHAHRGTLGRRVHNSVCLIEGCAGRLRSDNTSGLCRTHRGRSVGA